VNRIASFLAGALVALPQLALARAFDAGLVRSPAAFYGGCAAAALAIGAAAGARGARVAFLAAGAAVATAALYKVGIQTGRWSDLANGLDWVVVLGLTAVGVGVGVVAVRAHRRQAAA
jgi:hypothetical protein